MPVQHGFADAEHRGNRVATNLPLGSDPSTHSLTKVRYGVLPQWLRALQTNLAGTTKLMKLTLKGPLDTSHPLVNIITRVPNKIPCGTKRGSQVSRQRTPTTQRRPVHSPAHRLNVITELIDPAPCWPKTLTEIIDAVARSFRRACHVPELSADDRQMRPQPQQCIYAVEKPREPPGDHVGVLEDTPTERAEVVDDESQHPHELSARPNATVHLIDEPCETVRGTRQRRR